MEYCLLWLHSAGAPRECPVAVEVRLARSPDGVLLASIWGGSARVRVTLGCLGEKGGEEMVY